MMASFSNDLLVEFSIFEIAVKIAAPALSVCRPNFEPEMKTKLYSFVSPYLIIIKVQDFHACLNNPLSFG